MPATSAPPVVPEAIPAELTEGKRFTAWRYEDRQGQPKPAKVPYSPIMDDPRAGASSTTPSHWTTFDAALKYAETSMLSGLMRAFVHEDGMVGIDLDNCRDPETGELTERAAEIVKRIDTYAEISPSGTGIKLWAYAVLPPHGRKRGDVEMYGAVTGQSGPCGRFFTMTGRHLPGTPRAVCYRPDAVAAFHRETFGEAPDVTVAGGDPDRPIPALALGDEDVLKLASESLRNGEKFRRLWSGDTSDYAVDGNSGASEADAALCDILAYYGGPDPERIKRLWLRSGLYREKLNRADYCARTIDLALRGKTRFYGDSIQVPSTKTRSDGADTCACEDCPSRARVTYLERALLDRDDRPDDRNDRTVTEQAAIILRERARREAAEETVQGFLTVLAIPDTQMDAQTKIVTMFTSYTVGRRQRDGVALLPNWEIARGVGLSDNTVSEKAIDLAARDGTPWARSVTREYVEVAPGVTEPKSTAVYKLAGPARTPAALLAASADIGGLSDTAKQRAARARARAAESKQKALDKARKTWGSCPTCDNDMVHVTGTCPNHPSTIVGETIVRREDFDLLNPAVQDSATDTAPRTPAPVSVRPIDPAVQDSGSRPPHRADRETPPDWLTEWPDPVYDIPPAFR